MSKGWQRGHAFCQVTAPFAMDLNVVSYGWTGSTKRGGINADVVAVNSDDLPGEIQKKAQGWSGKVLFLAPLSAKHVNPLRVFSQLPKLLNSASQAHAAGVITGSGRPGVMLTHTGPAAFKDSYFPIPVLDVASEHQITIQRLLALKRPVRVKLDVDNTVVPSGTECFNVVADIPGAEKPDEFVILAAHLDSWDLSPGAVDDAAGVGTVMAAADAIVSQSVRPTRTVRVVLFTGEEEGLLGSLAYMRMHRLEAGKIVAAYVCDWGTGPMTKIPLAGHQELVSPLQHFTQTVSDIAQLSVDSSYLVFTDAYSFTLAGIPGVAFLQNSPDYVQIGHSAADTVDKVNKKNLSTNTAILGCLGYWTANYPSRLGLTYNRGQVAASLKRDGQQPVLELFDLWKLASGAK